MNKQMLKQLKVDVAIKQEQLQKLTDRIEVALQIQKSSLTAHQTLTAISSEISRVQKQQSSLKAQVESFKNQYISQLANMVDAIEQQYKSKHVELISRIEKEQKENKFLHAELEARNKTIGQKDVELETLKEKLNANMNFIIDNCELQVSDLDNNQGQQSQVQNGSQLNRYHQHEQLHEFEFPEDLFEEDKKNFSQLFQSGKQLIIEKNVESLCPTSYRIEHFGHHNSNPNVKQMRQNDNSSNFIPENELSKTSVCSKKDNKFWKNLTGQISSKNPQIPSVNPHLLSKNPQISSKNSQIPQTNPQIPFRNRNKENNKKGLGSKDKEILMDKITDFRKILFLDKGISRFGFK